ncbi:HNH endonuclease family protein [Desulfovibrio sp. ZJ369]|uniref:HNH endonuclease family protein n=1 Tax=Desulfovibrio sp. ZJ369 TaxID=2709793 RepID=UPI0013ED0A3E|nr:HNH endonuclease family protein [Desulfovibrio sp. ZJ369]
MPISAKLACVAKLGNLLPLGIELNSNIGNKEFASKMRAYQESRYQSVIKFLEEYKDKKDWTEEDINKRTDKLAEILYNRRS